MTLRLSLALLWLLHWLPLPALAALGDLLGSLAYHLATERRRVTLINLELCFPQWSASQRVAVARAHFQAFMTSILAQGVGWYAPLAHLRAIVHFEGLEHLQGALSQGPVILMTPHFFGIDTAGICLSADVDMISFHTRHKDLRIDDMIQRLRRRWNRGVIFARQDGIRAVLRALKPGWALYYLPDQDYGSRDSIFVDFFGVKTATIPAMSRLARLAQAQVVPCVIHQDFHQNRCRVCFYPPWQNFPGDDEAIDARRTNQFIEACILEQPANYLWSHKRFKTRPEGVPSPYER
ncbi:MAG: lysophospholipid acyltransferase family protein [Betaproteobacteria bacterium]|nr:lysophospholipid acyltransferase family protein [Betaproteobacteria bacterium]